MARVRSRRALHQLAALDFPRLDGGLNLSETEERLKPNESPEMENLWWEDGVLHSRPGQQRVELATDNGVRQPGPGFAVTEEPFHGNLFLHLGSRLYRWDGETDGDGRALLRQQDMGGTGAKNVPMNGGTFFRFGDFLFYKNRGGFRRIAYDALDRSFTVTDVAEDAFVPTTVINADPATGTGDLYQPENRLSPRKRVTYTPAAIQEKGTAHTGDGASRVFSIGGNTDSGVHAVAAVYVGGEEVPPALWDVNLRTGFLTFRTAPASGADITILLERNTAVYVLPVRDVDAVTEVQVDGRTLTEGSGYTVNRVYGQVAFAQAPPVHNPPAGNTVSITYSKENRDRDGTLAAYNAVMQCPYAAVCGSGTQLCVVLGGCPAQPNAVFWSGNTHLGLDPSYWPMEYYNLVGDTADPVNGFGTQYGVLCVFKARSLGKLACSTVTLDGRDSLSLTYTRINDKIGCDLPGSIQLIENNLVFANTSGGVFRVCSSSPAYENNVVCVSDRVNGSDQRPGLLSDLAALRRGGAAGSRFSDSLSRPQTGEVSSLDDGQRYFLTVHGHVWVWHYSLGPWDKPVWFRFTGFPAVSAWFRADGRLYHLDSAGQLTRLAAVYDDYGQGFPRIYQFPVQLCGSYNRLKDVLTVLIALRGEEPGSTDLVYISDYEQRAEQTPLRVPGARAIAPRDLSFRDLSASRHPAVFRRRPMCRHVRHFSMRLENSRAGEDMAILYAQMLVRLLGRDR